jgi:hypothetical protein
VNIISTLSKTNRNTDTVCWKISHKRVYTSLAPSNLRQIRKIPTRGSKYTNLLTDVCTKEGKNKKHKTLCVPTIKVSVSIRKFLINYMQL